MAPLPNILLTSALSALNTLSPPTRTLQARQSTVTVTTDPNNNNNSSQDNADPDRTTGLTGGAIAGIVIGSVVGVLLLAWIIRSCTNLGAPPGDDAVPGRPWYGGVRDEYPPRHVSRGRSRSRSRSRSVSRGSYHHHHHHRHHHHLGGRRSRSRRVSVGGAEVVPVAQVAPAVVVDDRRGYYGYGDGPVRGSRSRSRGRY